MRSVARPKLKTKLETKAFKEAAKTAQINSRRQRGSYRQAGSTRSAFPVLLLCYSEIT